MTTRPPAFTCQSTFPFAGASARRLLAWFAVNKRTSAVVKIPPKSSSRPKSKDPSDFPGPVVDGLQLRLGLGSLSDRAMVYLRIDAEAKLVSIKGAVTRFWPVSNGKKWPLRLACPSSLRQALLSSPTKNHRRLDRIHVMPPAWVIAPPCPGKSPNPARPFPARCTTSSAFCRFRGRWIQGIREHR